MIIFALNALVRSASVKWLHEPLQGGHVQQAARMAHAYIDEAGASPEAGRSSVPSANADDISDIALLCGDLMLAQDRDEEAEDCYRRAVKAATHGPRGAVRVLSCRTSGFINLYRQRYGAAAACLRRVSDDTAATPLQRIEALCGLALACYGMGHQDQAMALSGRAVEAAGALEHDACTPGLVMLASVLHTELRVRQDIRAHSELHDHVFWKAPAHAARPVQDPAQQPLLHPLAAVEACLDAYGAQTLVACHLRHLRSLIRVTCGDAMALSHLLDHLGALRRLHLSAPERQARLETALVAIVARNVDVARGVLEPLCARQGDIECQRWSLEMSYCLARICALSGHSEESLKHYQRYAMESMRCVRAETADPGPMDSPAGAGSSAVKDDVEMALPAKYRRAYRYMLEHLDCANLSVREIAEEIGVTERALQTAFRAQLGMTPAELLRRCRVERIRQDLLSGGAAGTSVIETASRWGIRSRSTLVSVYRKYFHETPAQTLQQRDGAAHAAGA